MRPYLTAFCFFLLLPVLALASSADVQLLKQARSQVKVVAGELKLRVAKEVQERGAENVLGSCRLQAAGITDRLSVHSGWEIRRTGMRVRNPDNAPDPWEAEVLELFRRRQAEGVDLQEYEFAKVVNMDGKRVFRYMKPIVMQEFCMTCHGDDIPPAVRAAIAGAYPGDRATGFRPGELRGAFSLIRILPGDPPPRWE